MARYANEQWPPRPDLIEGERPTRRRTPPIAVLARLVGLDGNVQIVPMSAVRWTRSHILVVRPYPDYVGLEGLEQVWLRSEDVARELRAEEGSTTWEQTRWIRASRPEDQDAPINEYAARSTVDIDRAWREATGAQ